MSSDTQKTDTESNKNEDENKLNNSQQQQRPQSTRLRSRFPKAQPNLGSIERKQPTVQTTPTNTDEKKEDAEKKRDLPDDNNESVSDSTVKIHEINEKAADKAYEVKENLVQEPPSDYALENQQSPVKKQVTLNVPSSPASSSSIQNNYLRIRSRFPKAQPNLAQSSSIERFRRISGHFSSNNNEVNSSSFNDQIPQTPQQQHHHEITSSNLPYKQILSPKIDSSSNIGSPLKRVQNEQTTTFKQFLNSNANTSNHSISIAHSQSPAAYIVGGVPTPGSHHNYHHHYSQPATPYATPIHSVYSNRFPKEQIKNVIKYIAMQKLKKIESEVG
jgi:hypothetical protein